jgi:hypothetical protein
MKRAGAAILAAMTICASHAAFAQAPQWRHPRHKAAAVRRRPLR